MTETRMPLTAAQSRLWLERFVDPERAAGPWTLAWDIRGAIDEGRLREAVAIVSTRHDALRATLDAHEPLQALGESRLAFSLDRQYDALRLMLSLPRECADERSLALLVRELSDAYVGRALPLVAPYRIDSPGGNDSSIGPWSPPTRIAPELPGDDRDSAAIETRMLPAELCGDRSRMLAAFVTLLQRHSGHDRIVLGVATPAATDTFGCFDPLLPLAIDDARDVERAWSSLRDHAAIPFSRLLELLQPARVPDRHPLFEITFALAHDRTLTLGDAEVSAIALAPPRARFDLELEAGERTTLTYRGARWPRAWARTFLEQYEALLRDPRARSSAVLERGRPLPADAMFLTAGEARIKIARAIKPQRIDASAIVFVGEPVTDTLIARWRSLFPSPAPIFALYENACVAPIADPLPRGVQPVGRPLPDREVRIVADDGADCAIGEIGALIIDGRPTGDRARVRSDGAVELCGRIDRATWVGGKLVDPDAIAHALHAIEGVHAARVMVEDGVDGQRRVAAEVPADQGALATIAQQFPSLIVRSTPVQPIDVDPLLSPRNPIELQLVRMWEQLLERDPIGVSDDFFTLGGDSMLAVELVARVEAEFGVVLSPAVLLPDATVEHLAHVIRHTRAPDASPLVTIQRGEGGPPLVCIHPSGGSVLCYVDLARALGREQPILGLQGRDPRDPEPPPQHASDLAAHFIAALRAAQPRGPYMLAGYSFGGLIASEMAQQLARDGDAIALLALLDTRFPRDYGPEDRNPVVDLGAILERYDLDAVQVGEEQEHALWRELIDLAARYLGEQGKRRRSWSAVQEFCRLYRLMPAADDLGYHDLRRFLRNLRANFRTMRHYQPSPLDVPSVLFSASRTVEGKESDHARNAAHWRSVLPRLDVRIVDANHFNLLAPPSVNVLARSLRELLP